MATSDLPERVRALLNRHVATVLELDVLVAARGAGRDLTAAELARDLRLNEDACALALAKFADAGFLEADGAAYRFKPRVPALLDDVDAVADAYARRRVSVIRFIYKRPSQGVSAFADAFRLRRDD